MPKDPDHVIKNVVPAQFESIFLQMQGLPIAERRTLSNLISAHRGPDHRPSIGGMGTLKDLISCRLRFIMWGPKSITNTIARHPMDLYGVKDIKTYLLKACVLETGGRIKQPGMEHFLSHLVLTFNCSWVQDHPVWGGYGKILHQLLSTRGKDPAVITPPM